jgi:hypothetical protein
MPWPGLSLREALSGYAAITRLHPDNQTDPEAWPSSPVPASQPSR